MPIAADLAEYVAGLPPDWYREGWPGVVEELSLVKLEQVGRRVTYEWRETVKIHVYLDEAGVRELHVYLKEHQHSDEYSLPDTDRISADLEDAFDEAQTAIVKRLGPATFRGGISEAGYPTGYEGDPLALWQLPNASLVLEVMIFGDEGPWVLSLAAERPRTHLRN